VLLLDEPTSALDPELVNEVLDVIRRLAIDDGLTMIISTHQLRFAEEVADRVLLLSGGAIVEEGPAREVLTIQRRWWRNASSRPWRRNSHGSCRLRFFRNIICYLRSRA